VGGTAVSDFDESMAGLIAQGTLDVDLTANAAEQPDVLFALSGRTADDGL